MRRTFFVFALLLAALAAAPVRAQESTWTKVYDVPADQFVAVEMFDDTRGILAASAALFYTTDGGATWDEATIDAPAASGRYSGPSSLAFGDADHAWVAGHSGQIWRTEDGGRSWNKQPSGTNAHIGSISAVSGSEAWATALGEGFSDVIPPTIPGAALLHTSDGGATWTPARLSEFGVFRDVSFADARRGWVAASRCFSGRPWSECPTRFGTNVLLRTRDGGASWEEVPLPVAGANLARLQALPGDSGAVGLHVCPDGASCRTTLHYTEDDGDTWRVMKPSETSWQDLSWRFLSAERGYATAGVCGVPPCRNPLWETTDAGVTWREVMRGAFSYGTSFAATSTSVFLASPHSPVPFLSVDPATGGARMPVTPARPSYFDVSFATDTVGYATSEAGVSRTDDGGASWSRPTGPSGIGWLAALSESTVLALVSTRACAMRCVEVYRSADGGETWLATGQSFESAHSFETGNGRAWISGEDGLWRTDDAGASWKQVDAGPGTWSFHGDVGFAVDCGIDRCDGRFLLTTDGGTTVHERPLPPRARPAFFVSAAAGWAIGLPSAPDAACQWCHTMWSTQDGGRTWQEVWRSDTAAVHEMLLIDARRGWAQFIEPTTGRSLYLGYTEDGGRTWRSELTGAGGTLHVGRTRAWLVEGNDPAPFYGYSGERTTIWRRDFAAPLIAPAVGAGPGDARRGSWPALLAAAGCAVLLAGVALRRPPRFD